LCDKHPSVHQKQRLINCKSRFQSGFWSLKAAISSLQMYHHQQQLHSHSHFLSSRQTFPPERHLLLQGGSIPAEPGLVLSTDAKPRLKWTPELHERFVDAVNQLGGPDSKYMLKPSTYHTS